MSELKLRPPADHARMNSLKIEALHFFSHVARGRAKLRADGTWNPAALLLAL